LTLRIYLSIFILVIVVFIVVFRGRDDNNSTAVSVWETNTACQKGKPASTEFSSPLIVTGDKGEVRVRGLVFTACIDPTLVMEPQFLILAYKNAQGVVSQQYEANNLKTTLDVKKAAGFALFYFTQSNSDYQGRISVYVNTVPPTGEDKALRKQGGSSN
jgi:hypothetical protein